MRKLGRAVRLGLLLLLWVTVSAEANGQARREDPSADSKTMPLWDGKAPGAEGEADEDRPTLTFYPPSQSQSPTTAVIVMPGGSYGWLATNHEGRQVAIWLVRTRAKEFGVAPNKIGVLGFSAGGHLASTTITLFDGGNARATDPVDRASSR